MKYLWNDVKQVAGEADLQNVAGQVYVGRDKAAFLSCFLLAESCARCSARNGG